MTKADRAVSVVVLAGSEVEYDAVRRHLADVEPVMPLSLSLSSPEDLEIGTISGSGVHIALGRLGRDRSSDALNAAAQLRPRAILVVSLADALRDDAEVGDVVMASRIDHFGGQFGNVVTTWLPDTALWARAADIAQSGWQGTDGQTPYDLHLGLAAAVHDPTTLTPPVTIDLRDALVIDRERERPTLRGDLPTLFVYGVSAHVSRRRDVSTFPRSSPALANLAAFTLALASHLDATEDEQVRRLRGRGHGDRVAEKDLLARGPFVESLAELLAYAPAAEEDKDLAGPTVIAIEGAWGAGKSTLMDLTKAELRKLKPSPQQRTRWWEPLALRWRRRKLRVWEADFSLNGWLTPSSRDHEFAEGHVLIAEFNPWSYVTGEHVWAGLNKCIVDAVVDEDADTANRFWFVRNVKRLDRRHVQRTLRKRILSPLLRLAVFALPVPLLVQVLRGTSPYTVLGFAFQPVDLTLSIIAVLLAAGFAHTAARYVFRRADTLLPAELFGPSGALSARSVAVGTDDPLRDPHRRARTGLLHGMQEDVRELLGELDGQQLVVFIDDLDRCSPRTTADVFEAINGFLTGSFPAIRFVLGIDAAATAAHLDAAYSALVAADAGREVADPSPGWTFLRKLIQLPLPLPRVLQTQVEPLLAGLLGTRTPPVQGSAEVTAPEAEAQVEAAVAPVAVTAAEQPAGEIHTAPAVLTLEHDEQVKDRLAERLRAQPDLSVREAKRIITVWMFYIRVVDRLSPRTGLAAVRRACHLVLLAEIVARWPASQRCLHRRVDGTHGLAALAKAVEDNVQWEIEVRRFGLAGERHKAFRDGVEEILRHYDGEEIAKLAELLT